MSGSKSIVAQPNSRPKNDPLLAICGWGSVCTQVEQTAGLGKLHRSGGASEYAPTAPCSLSVSLSTEVGEPMTAIATKKAAIEGRAIKAYASQNYNTSDPNVTILSCGAAEFSVADRTRDVSVVCVTGEVDLCSADALRDFVCAQCDKDTDIVIDLSQVHFFGTAGLTVFTGMERVSRQEGRNWALVGARPIHRLLRAVGQADLFQCFDSREAAVSALNTRRTTASRAS